MSDHVNCFFCNGAVDDRCRFHAPATEPFHDFRVGEHHLAKWSANRELTLCSASMLAKMVSAAISFFRPFFGDEESVHCVACRRRSGYAHWNQQIIDDRLTRPSAFPNLICNFWREALTTSRVKPAQNWPQQTAGTHFPMRLRTLNHWHRSDVS